MGDIKKVPTRSQNEETIELAIKKGFFSPSSELFGELTRILNFVPDDTVLKWNDEKVDASN